MDDKQKLEIALRRYHYCPYGCDYGKNGNRLCDRCCIKVLQEYIALLNEQKTKWIEAALECIGQGRISELRENLVSMRQK